MTNELKPMKKATTSQLSVIILLTVAMLIINGCKKEPVVKTIAPVTLTSTSTDSAVYMKGYFDGQPVSFEGNANAYHAFVDPDSAQSQGGQGFDNDAYYQSGSQWMKITNQGTLTSNASVEIRSLAVRVFVSPIASLSSDYYNLLNPTAYPLTDNHNAGNGAYITLHDKNGVLWTSHGDQDGSTLVILTRGTNLNTYTVVTGTVSCKLYDGEGNMKMLTAASFTAALGI